MDVKEFLDSLSMMCKQGIKTKEFRESEMGKKMAQDHPKYKTFDFDFYDIWWTHTEGDVTQHWRDELYYINLEGSKYASIEFKRWNAIVKYALECYFRANNFIFEREKQDSSNKGWYVYTKISATLVNEFGREVDNWRGYMKSFPPTDKGFIIGYRGKDLSFDHFEEVFNSYDFNFGGGKLFWNLNHDGPWVGDTTYYFTPTIKSSPSFMNWDDNPLS